MDNAAVVMDLEGLPEGCIANVIGKTTPRDACRLTLVSRQFKSAADSDAVWNKFLPAETNEILLLSEDATDSKSKKELYLTHNPILIDDGMMSFSLEKWTGKKSYMIAARGLKIGSGDDTPLPPRYWKWESLPDSRFKEAIRFFYLGGFNIHGRIETRRLSPCTTYEAYLVYKLSRLPYAKMVTAVVARASGFVYEHPGSEEETTSCRTFRALQRRLDEMVARKEMIRYTKFPNKSREDGWLEMELGEFHCRGGEDRRLEMACIMFEDITPLGDLLVQGIEIRPKMDCIGASNGD